MRAFSTAYQSYLLRLWCEADGGEWRASLENVETCECHNFPNMSSLFAFLYSRAGESNTNMCPEDMRLQISSETRTPVFYEFTEEEV